jgi:hypothetical protein
MFMLALVEIFCSPAIMSFYAIRAIAAMRAKKQRENYIASPAIRTIPATHLS